MWWYKDMHNNVTLCARCGDDDPQASRIEPDETTACDMCGRTARDDDEQAQIRQALYLSRAQLELAQPLFAERRRRHDLVKTVDHELRQSYQQADDAWKARSRRLLTLVRQWLDRYDLSEDGPSILGEANGNDNVRTT